MRLVNLLSLCAEGWDPEGGPAPRAGGSAPAVFSRRTFLQAAVATAIPVYSGHGRIKPPAPVPDVQLLCQSGASATLGSLVAGHATAVQLMFTQCTTTCPIQAAIFQRVQRLVPDMSGKGIQLLSLSIDPVSDTPKALSAWLRRFHAGPAWIAAAPSAKDGSLLQEFFGRAKSSYADHSTQVNIVDRSGQLVWRTIELPTAEEIAEVLENL
jgi:protein SCO1/2